ncbi:hypothetical protein DEU56DRAFT_801205 [Suillus clintonianus]|uniref:uncharacterized protein n=1 Tax=Suillus clintonianus TaxID=1904413 RepID=UPI001B883074|nr:uncharacterized protein DEU56DRAFT_801205 [Suillus clintonianus]KAG2138993.1 hypothetical protein DEU56DRAFT_801205 [Suillus clintonianus]
MSLQPFISLYRYALEPIAPFTWFGTNVCSLDLVAVFRLCVALRQMRENLYAKHQRTAGENRLVPAEERSFVRDACTVLTVVFGGEAIIGPLLGILPSFMLSSISPGLYIAAHAIVEYIPVLPSVSLSTELPLSFVDGFTRAMLLCSLIPPPVITHTSPVVASSPWALLLSSFIITNGGFFITNMFSFVEPTPLTLTTPAELQPYGWTATDLWSAPLITGFYALLTHAQPFWAEFHSVISTVLGGAGGKVEPMDPESARALCALILVGIFSTRTAKNFGLLWKKSVAEKIKIQ